MDDLTRSALLVLVRAALGRQDHAELLNLQELLEHDERLAHADKATRKKGDD
jgi:hypothetical protein